MSSEYPIALIDFSKKYSEIYTSELGGFNFKIAENSYIVTTLWLRIIELNKGVIILADTGLATNGFILLRTMCETAVIMENVIKFEGFSDIYFNKVHKEKARRLKSISSVLKQTRLTFSPEELRELQKESEDLIAGQVSSFVMKDLFYRVDHIALYELVYSHCCMYTHSEASILDRYLDDGFKPPKVVTNRSVKQDTILTCLMAARLMHHCFETFSKFAGFESVKTKNFWKECDELQAKYSTD